MTSLRLAFLVGFLLMAGATLAAIFFVRIGQADAFEAVQLVVDAAAAISIVGLTFALWKLELARDARAVPSFTVHNAVIYAPGPDGRQLVTFRVSNHGERDSELGDVWIESRANTDERYFLGGLHRHAEFLRETTLGEVEDVLVAAGRRVDFGGYVERLPRSRKGWLVVVDPLVMGGSGGAMEARLAWTGHDWSDPDDAPDTPEGARP